MYALLVLAVLIIALLIAKRMLWREYGPQAAATLRRTDWSSAGIHFFAWTSGIALVLAAVYYVRSTAHGNWLAVVIGLAIGIVLLVVSGSRDGLMANALTGAGIGILCVTIYAMQVRWRLVPLPVALIAMLVMTAAAVFLASRRGSLCIAILGLLGGFAMPALLPFTGQPVELFVYLLVLNAGMSWLAYRMRWPPLIALSVARVTLYEWTWVVQSLTSSQLGLAALIFAAFAIVAAAPFLLRMWNEYPPRFRNIAAVAILLPLFFAFFMASNANYGLQYNVLFGFLLLIALSLFAVVWHGGPAWLHVSGGIATLLTFFIWFWQWGRDWSPDTWPPRPVPGLVLYISIWLALFIALYLARTTVFASLLFLVFIGLALRQPEDYVTLVAVLVGVTYAVVHTFIRRGNPILAAIAIALSAIALMVLNPLSPLFLMNPSHTSQPPPAPWPMLVAFGFLFAATFAVAWLLDRPVLAVIAVAFYAGMLTTSYLSTTASQLASAIVPYAFFLAYAFVAGTRAKTSIAPNVAVVLASLVFFFSASTTLARFAGVVPLIIAALLLVLLWRSDRTEPRFTLLLSAALAFFNAALPLLLPKPWIAVVLALQVVALIWFFTRFAYRGFLVWATGIAVVLFLWMSVDGGLYTYLDNAAFYVYIFGFAYAICSMAMFAAAYLTPKEMTRLRLMFSLAGLIESWFLVNIIIANLYHSSGGPLNIDFLSFSGAEDVTYTIAWALIAASLLFIGFHWNWQGARVGATGLLILSILKCFLHDLVRRGDPYRVASLLGVAVSLIVVGVILQRRTHIASETLAISSR